MMDTRTTLRTVVLSFGVLAAATLAPATGAWAFGGLGGGTASDVKSQGEIRALYTKFVSAWNKHDVATMASNWAVDGDHVEPDGQVAKGQDEVAALLKKQHDGVFKTTTLDLAVKTVWMISDTVALVDGTYELAGARLPDGTELPSRTGMLTSVLILEKSKWAIAASRLMIPTGLPYKPDAQ